MTKLLIALAGLSLLAALWSGLIRLGWNLPGPTSALPLYHGPLMVVGFLGTLIGVERAVAMERGWAYGAPLCGALSGLALLLGLPVLASQILAVLSSLVLTSIFLVLYRRQPVGFLGTMGLGAFFWLVGNLLWLGGYPLYRVIPWWIGFPVITIAGERRELSRLVSLPPWARAWFFLANGLFGLGLALSVALFEAGIGLSAGGLIALALWLLRWDIAGRTVLVAGLPRYSAACLLTGYVWLVAGGLLWLFSSDLFGAGAAYDAIVHAVFLGFVFSMIFGHAPIIFPSVLGVAMPFQRAFYAHLALLHLSLLLRVAGDLGGWALGRRWGGLLNVLAVLFFLGNNVRAVVLGRTEASRSP